MKLARELRHHLISIEFSSVNRGWWCSTHLWFHSGAPFSINFTWRWHELCTETAGWILIAFQNAIQIVYVRCGQTKRFNLQIFRIETKKGKDWNGERNELESPNSNGIGKETFFMDLLVSVHGIRSACFFGLNLFEDGLLHLQVVEHYLWNPLSSCMCEAEPLPLIILCPTEHSECIHGDKQMQNLYFVFDDVLSCSPSYVVWPLEQMALDSCPKMLTAHSKVLRMSLEIAHFVLDGMPRSSGDDWMGF